MQDLKETMSAGGEIGLEASSLEAIVTCWLKRVSRDSIASSIDKEVERFECGMPLNSSELISRRLWGGLPDEYYREVFLLLVGFFVNGNKELVRKMLDGEFKTQWD